MPMTNRFQKYKKIGITWLKKYAKKIFSYSSAFFTQGANRSHCISFVVTHLRWITTATWATPRICSNLGS
jgi:hypothetical protein